MRSVGCQHENVSFADRFPSPLALDVDVFQHYVAFELVEELIAGINVKVSSRVGAADDHDDELRVFPDHLRADRRFQQRTMLIDPTFEVERLEMFCHALHSNSKMDHR